MMARWTSPTRLPGHGGERSLPSTRPRSSPSTTRCRSARASGARLLRREGLYSSHLAEWRKARDAGARDGLAPKAKAKRSAEQVELERLRRRNERLEAELAKTKIGAGVTGKAHALLEVDSPRARTPTRSRRRDRRAHFDELER